MFVLAFMNKHLHLCVLVFHGFIFELNINVDFFFCKFELKT
jgi:hypothetical protein